MGSGKTSEMAEKRVLLSLSFLVLSFTSLLFIPVEVSVASDTYFRGLKETTERDAYGSSAEKIQKPKSVIHITTEKEKRAEADELLAKGIQKYKTENFETALQAWTEALNLYRDLNDRKNEAEVIKNIQLLIAP